MAFIFIISLVKSWSYNSLKNFLININIPVHSIVNVNSNQKLTGASRPSEGIGDTLYNVEFKCLAMFQLAS